MPDQVRLHAPIEVSGGDVERALFEQSRNEPAVARAFERLCGAAAESAADELNRALAVDIFDLLAQGWAQLPTVQSAIQLSALTRGPPTLVEIDRHRIASKSLVVLETNTTESELPPLELALEVHADIQGATLSARSGGIDLVSLGEASIVARLAYKGVLVKEHVTGMSGVGRDPFRPLASAPVQPASVDILI